MHIRKLELAWPCGTVEERSFIDYRATAELGTGEIVQVTTGHDASGVMLWCDVERIKDKNNEF